MRQKTVGERIAAGYAVILLLLIAVAGLGSLALSRSSATFKEAILAQGKGLTGALKQRRAISSAQADYLRYLLTSDDKALAEKEIKLVQAREALAELRDTSATPEIRAGWGEVLTLLNAWDETAMTAVAAQAAGRHEEALRIREERSRPMREKLDDLATRLGDAEVTRSNETSRAASESAARTTSGLLLITLLAVAAAGLIGWRVTRSITMSLRDTIATLASAASEIVASTTQQAAGAAEEATAVQETSTTVDEIKQTSQLSSQKARRVAEASQKCVQVSQDGRRAAEESVRGMEETKVRMETIAERILALSERAQAIGDVIAVVNDLAEQSNLLAVNAAIEAAKAGDAGKGFGVVAVEVKALAEQSKQATSQVRGILNEIQKTTQSAVMAAEQGVKASETGVGLVTRSGEAIRLLSENLMDSAQAAQQILASSEQQAAGMDQVVLAIRNIQQASSQNMASTRQVERAAQDLNELTRRLKTLISSDDPDRPARPRPREAFRPIPTVEG